MSGTVAARETDAIAVLSADHERVERLFAEYERSGPEERRPLVDALLEELKLHISLEEEFFYPAMRSCCRMQVGVLLTESIEQHDRIEEKIVELSMLEPSHESHDATVRELIQLVRQHVAQEELQLFPLSRDELGADRLDELAAQLVERRAALVARDTDNPGQPLRDGIAEWLVTSETGENP